MFPEFDPSNRDRPIGLEDSFYENFGDMLDRAQSHNIQIIASLFDFIIFNDMSNAGSNAGFHKGLFDDPENSQAFIDNVMKPLAERYKNHGGLLAWEIMNEPEWAMDIAGGGNTDTVISKRAMQRFVAQSASAIHSFGGDKQVTVGSASWKWSSDIKDASEENLWSDEALQSVLGQDPKAYLDFYQIHYYDWMSPWYDPYSQNITAFTNEQKPVLIGETPAAGSSLYLGSRGIIIPTTSTDSFFAELALWYGVEPGDLSLLFPNLGNFHDLGSLSTTAPPLGFMNM